VVGNPTATETRLEIPQPIPAAMLLSLSAVLMAVAFSNDGGCVDSKCNTGDASWQSNGSALLQFRTSRSKAKVIDGRTTAEDDARFLMRATFGPTRSSLEVKQGKSNSDWIQDQMDPAKFPMESHREYYRKHVNPPFKPRVMPRFEARGAAEEGSRWHRFTITVSDDGSQGQKQAGGPSIAVLLTTYNEPQRTEMYAKRLDWWLTQTMLPLFVVDSYNRKFPEEGQTRFRQFRVHHFDQFPILGPPPFGGSTISELLSLKEALKAFQNEWEQYDYVVKVTGKYILPDLVALMANIDKGKDFIVEASAFSLNANTNPNPGWVGTECITFNTKKMGELVAKIEQQPYPAIENKLAALLHTHTFQRLPPMPIPDAYRIKRAIGDTLTSVIEEGKGAL